MLLAENEITERPQLLFEICRCLLGFRRFASPGRLEFVQSIAQALDSLFGSVRARLGVDCSMLSLGNARLLGVRALAHDLHASFVYREFRSQVDHVGAFGLAFLLESVQALAQVDDLVVSACMGGEDKLFRARPGRGSDRVAVRGESSGRCPLQDRGAGVVAFMRQWRGDLVFRDRRCQDGGGLSQAGAGYGMRL